MTSSNSFKPNPLRRFARCGSAQFSVRPLGEVHARSLLLVAALSVTPSLSHAGGVESLDQPLGVTLGAPDSCENVRARYSVEEITGTDDSMTLRLLAPEAAFPRAERVVAVCDGEALVSLSVTANFGSKHYTNADELLVALNKDFARSYECPSLSEEPHRCSYFHQGNVVAIFTAAESEPEFYSLTYGYIADPQEFGRKMLQQQPRG